MFPLLQPRYYEIQCIAILALYVSGLLFSLVDNPSAIRTARISTISKLPDGNIHDSMSINCNKRTERAGVGKDWS